MGSPSTQPRGRPARAEPLGQGPAPASKGRRGVAVLGSTGSIGRSTLDVLRRHQEHFKLVALTAGRNRDEFAAQVAEWRPTYAGLAGVRR